MDIKKLRSSEMRNDDSVKNWLLIVILSKLTFLV